MSQLVKSLHETTGEVTRCEAKGGRGPRFRWARPKAPLPLAFARVLRLGAPLQVEELPQVGHRTHHSHRG